MSVDAEWEEEENREGEGTVGVKAVKDGGGGEGGGGGGRTADGLLTRKLISVDHFAWPDPPVLLPLPSLRLPCPSAPSQRLTPRRSR